MRVTRHDLDLADWRQTLFLDDPRTWRIWETVAWLLPVVMCIIIPLLVYILWRLDAGTH